MQESLGGWCDGMTGWFPKGQAMETPGVFRGTKGLRSGIARSERPLDKRESADIGWRRRGPG